MLFSENKKERLAESLIGLVEIKATKKIILEELTKANEDIRDKLATQLSKHVRIYGQNLRPVFEKTEAENLVNFVNNLVENSEKCLRRLGDDMDDKQFFVDIESITAWHNLGLALAFFLKKIPNAIAGFDEFVAKAEAAGPDSSDRIFEIFPEPEEQQGMKDRFAAALREPIRILAVLSEEDYEEARSNMRQTNAKFEDVTATLPEFIDMVKEAYGNKPGRASQVGISDKSFGLTDPVDLEPDRVIEGLIDSTFSSVNALLGNKKIRKAAKKTPIEQIKDYLAAPGEEGSPHTSTSRYNDAMKKLAAEIKNEIGEDLDATDTKEFVKEVLKLLQDRSVDETKMLKMIDDSKK